MTARAQTVWPGTGVRGHRERGRHDGVIAAARHGNEPTLASGSVSVPSRARAGDGREQDVRRLRDLLRSALLAGWFPDGALPGDTDLMAAYGASRATVREALALLRADGVIERLPGVGTHLMASPPRTGLDEAHGVTAGGDLYVLTTPPRVLDRSTIPAPPTLATALGVATGTDVLRLEYVGMHDGVPAVVATNYVLYPEARHLLGARFHGHWYQLMADAGVELGSSEFVIDAITADPVAADLLDVAPGAPLLAVEQTISDPRGRVIDVAFLLLRPDRMRFVSRADVVAPRPS